MEKTYLEQLNEITEAAQQAIAQIVRQKKNIILFSATDNEEEEWTVDIYDMPDFPFYDKYNCVEYAAIKEIHLNGGDIEITGILKGESYSKQIKVKLTELETYSSAALADCLQATNTDTTQTL